MQNVTVERFELLKKYLLPYLKRNTTKKSAAYITDSNANLWKISFFLLENRSRGY